MMVYALPEDAVYFAREPAAEALMHIFFIFAPAPLDST
jgi:hypothetical protein